jgi:hypothetical protein
LVARCAKAVGRTRYEVRRRDRAIRYNPTAINPAKAINRLVVEAAGTLAAGTTRPFTWNARSWEIELHVAVVHCPGFGPLLM